MQPTYEGFCCVFNYHSGLDHRNQVTVKAYEAGWHEGLVVTVYNEPEDYVIPIIPSEGVNVHIFNPHDYPDASSGGLIEELIPIGTESFLNLEPSTIYSVPEVRSYPPSIRRCMFEDEMSTLFGQYSLSNCLLECRIKSMLALCQCAPTLLITNLNITECSISDIPCLQKFQEKWQSLYPENFESDELEQEKQNSLSCSHCYASCEDTSYRVSTDYAPLNLRGANKACYQNYSIIRVYFGKEHSKLYKQDVVYNWYEILSNFGGLIGIFLGISCVSVIEFIYFFTFRYIVLLKTLKS